MINLLKNDDARTLEIGNNNFSKNVLRLMIAMQNIKLRYIFGYYAGNKERNN